MSSIRGRSACSNEEDRFQSRAISAYRFSRTPSPDYGMYSSSNSQRSAPQTDPQAALLRAPFAYRNRTPSPDYGESTLYLTVNAPQTDPQAEPLHASSAYRNRTPSPDYGMSTPYPTVNALQTDPQTAPLVFGQPSPPPVNVTDVANSIGSQWYCRLLFNGNYELVNHEYAPTNGYDQRENTWPWSRANASHDNAETSQPPQTQEEAKPHTKRNTKKDKPGQGGQKRVKDEEVAQQLATPGLYVEHFWTFARLPSRDKTGQLQQSCRNVQTAFDEADPDTKGRMMAMLQGHILDAIKCRCANRVVEFIITKMPAALLTPLIAEITCVIAENPAILRHEHGCRLVQRLLEECQPGQISAIVDACLLKGVSLIVHEYGNHVNSCILKHGTNGNIEALTKTLTENVEEVARSEHGPSVLSAALASKSKFKDEDGTRRYRQGAHVEALANALVSQPNLLVEMASGKKTGRHGHLAAQDAINCASAGKKEAVLLQLMQHTTELRTPKAGQHKDELRYAKVFAKFIDHEAKDYRFDTFGLDDFQGHVSTQGMSGPHGSLSMSSAPEIENDDGDEAVLSETEWPHLTGPRPPTGAAITATVWA